MSVPRPGPPDSWRGQCVSLARETQKLYADEKDPYRVTSEEGQYTVIGCHYFRDKEAYIVMCIRAHGGVDADIDPTPEQWNEVHNKIERGEPTGQAKEVPKGKFSVAFLCTKTKRELGDKIGLQEHQDINSISTAGQDHEEDDHHGAVRGALDAMSGGPYPISSDREEEEEPRPGELGMHF